MSEKILLHFSLDAIKIIPEILGTYNPEIEPANPSESNLQNRFPSENLEKNLKPVEKN